MITNPSQDPMQFVRSLWSGAGFAMPGMVAPTFSTDDLSKRIADLKAVEVWLRMNLSMLQMAIQGLEMQQTTLSTVEAVGKMVRSGSESDGFEGGGDGPTVGETWQRAALWPLEIMQHMQDRLQQHLQEAEAEAAKTAAASKKSAAPKTSAAASSGKSAPRKTVRKSAKA
ncbi:MAG: hypothetical protein FWH15_09985 [Betaproteobacteria bacterium]|nr:hypothetical protein [Betaproteobacteria bacterium]